MTAAAPWALFCWVMGVLAVGAGALAALLVPAGEVRGPVWTLVTVLVAAGAGLWSGLTPGTGRLRVPDRAPVAPRPRGPERR
ncbi:hypothetical protein GTY82_00370 [Streptomyces sp. SID5476]|uniref:Integral membrane protein n=1 Tax=Streptomyces bottropensis ATCC 25435 TaxID=1054862 RepID=M3FQ70_9ACTN|nr:hypothetical protein SBD_2428 [Streptomyces bottropensis ATCC 25435]MZD15720.1 hypothetical protein [Streptomyces sp. SID5476]